MNVKHCGGEPSRVSMSRLQVLQWEAVRQFKGCSFCVIRTKLRLSLDRLRQEKQRSFWTTLNEELSSWRFRTMLLYTSFIVCDRGSHLVAYLVIYSITLRLDTQYCISTLPLQADSWTGLWLLINPSFLAVSTTGSWSSSSSLIITVSGCRGLGYPNRHFCTPCLVAGGYEIIQVLLVILNLWVWLVTNVRIGLR